MASLHFSNRLRVSLPAFGALALLLGSIVGPPPAVRREAAKPAAPASIERVRAAYHARPLAFEANVGQADPQLSFCARAANHGVCLADDWTELELRSASGEGETVRMRLEGARANAAPVGDAPLAGRVNYFIGNDPSRWHVDVPTFERVRRHDVYPGIDVVYYGREDRLEYDFVVAPGASVGDIRMRFDGAEVRGLGPDGELVLTTPDGDLRQHRPMLFQVRDGIRRTITGGYLLNREGSIGFEADSYDRSLPLVIDPVLTYSTFLGGSGSDTPSDVAVDAAGNAYVTGGATTGLPQKGGLHTPLSGVSDVFIAKLNADGSDVVFTTYLGGSNTFPSEGGNGIAVDRNGFVYVCGNTASADFPTVNALQPSPRTPGTGFGLEGFAAKLSPGGDRLLYSTYLSGSASDSARAIAVDPAGNAIIVGETQSSDFPIVRAIKAAIETSGSDAFITKLDAAGQPIFSTYWGGSGLDSAVGIALDPSGNPYVLGSTTSFDFPLKDPFQSVARGTTNVFVSK
jgi:hypothetical protein